VIYVEICIMAISSAVLIFFATPIADHYFSPQESPLFVLGFVALTPGMLTAIFSAVLEGGQLFKYQTLHSITVTPLALMTKIVLMLKGFGVESLLWSNLAFSLVNLAYYAWAVKKEGLVSNWMAAKKYGGEDKKAFLKYCRSVYSIQLVDQVVWSRSENYFLGRFCHASQVAYYNLSQNLLLRFTSFIPALMWRILLPVASEQEAVSDLELKKRTYYHSVRYSAFCIFPLVTICLICAYELIVIVYGQDYAEAKSCFQILCIGALITSLTQPGSAMIYAANRQQFIFWFGLGLAALNILLDILLIPKYGAVGAALCFTSVTTLGASGGFFFLTRHMQLKVPWLSLVKILFSCNCLALGLFLIIRQDTAYFDLFPGFRNWLSQVSGLNFDSIIGPRALRFLFSIIAGGTIYIIVSLSLFSLSHDDIRIIKTLERFMPRGTAGLILRWKQK
jgi:O-antigen/teichoic acid export membrane protein